MKRVLVRKYTLIILCLLVALICNTYPWQSKQTFGDEPRRMVYVGGFPIGLTIKPKGVIVVGTAPVETEVGSVTPQTPLCGGDIIESIDGKETNNADDIYEAIKETDGMNVELGVRRGASFLKINASLIKEDMTGEKRLGIQIRENVAGVGTVTYIKPDGSFGCLGHPITLDNGSMVSCAEGFSYECKILGCNKGTRGKAGELKGAFSNSTPNGTLYKNCKSGIYGKFENFENFSGELIKVEDRHNVKMGKADIIATVDDKTQRYSAEIIKVASQNCVSDKSMIIRITDKRLISATGGIVQGMSGSPIIQNGKLIGAVTHVFISDPTKGYGIFADWMYSN